VGKFGMNDLAEIIPGRCIHESLRSLGRPSLVETTSSRGRASTQRNPPSHAVEPTRGRLSLADRAGTEHEDQESCLDGILRLVLVAEDRAANAQDHRAMPFNQGREREFGRIAVAMKETPEKLAIGQPSGRSNLEQRTDVPSNGRGLMLRHWFSPREPPPSLQVV
jgi:hypothetical protein